MMRSVRCYRWAKMAAVSAAIATSSGSIVMAKPQRPCPLRRTRALTKTSRGQLFAAGELSRSLGATACGLGL
jgi:hypothetical protein